MLFVEFRFFWFFLAVFAVYWSFRKNDSRKIWLLVCSYFFYACWNWSRTTRRSFTSNFESAIATQLGIRQNLPNEQNANDTPVFPSTEFCKFC